MAQTKKQRGRGTGSIYKEGKRFYFKVRINHKTKTQLLRDQNDQPVTNRQDAEKAAALLEPVLRAQQKEEIALYVAEAKNLKKSLTLTVDELWHFYLSSRKRGDLAPLTLKGQQTAVRLFVDWLKSKHPEIVHLDQINKTIAMEYSDDRSMSNISAVTFNKYISYLNLVFNRHFWRKIDKGPESPYPTFMKKRGADLYKTVILEKKISLKNAGHVSPMLLKPSKRENNLENCRKEWLWKQPRSRTFG